MGLSHLYAGDATSPFNTNLLEAGETYLPRNTSLDNGGGEFYTNYVQVNHVYGTCALER